MKLFEIAPSLTTSIDNIDEDLRTIYVWHKDSSNNIFYLVLRRSVVNTDFGQTLTTDRLNSVDQGYNDILSILNGTFEFNPTKKPIIYSKLLIQNKELLGTDAYFNPIYLGFFDKELLGSAERAAHSLFGFSFDRDIRINSNSDMDIPCIMASNIYNDSFNTKQYPRNARGPIWRAFVGVPVHNNDCSDVFIATFRQYHSKTIYTKNINESVTYCTPDEFYSSHILSSFPTCSININKQNDSYTVHGTCTFKDKPLSDVNIYLSTTGGYLAKTRVLTDDNGEFSTTFIPLGLTIGDTVNIQCGFRLFTGIVDVDLTV